MISLGNIVIYLMEGLAITGAIYLISGRLLPPAELVTLALSISVTFMILDLFAPGVASGARQGSGFGLGFRQVAGASYPYAYYNGNGKVESNLEGFNGRRRVIEGMDDPTAVNYYQRLNPSYGQPMQLEKNSPLSLTGNAQQIDQAPEGVSAGPQLADYKLEKVTHSIANAQIPSQILQQFKQNPFDTTNVSANKTDSTLIYDRENIPPTSFENEPNNIYYSPVKPSYGSTYQFPRGWEEVEQNNLHRAFGNYATMTTQKKNI